MYFLTSCHMKNVLQKLKLGKHFAPYKKLFDARTYESFKAVIESFIYFQKVVQADMAEHVKKSVSALQYFFQYAKWKVSEVNRFRLRILRNKSETRDRESDMLVLDGSALSKDKDAMSEYLSQVWDNRKKQSVNGYEMFGAGIVTAEGQYYPLDIMIYLEEKYKSLFCGWIKFLKKCLKKTKAKLVVMDRGFKNQYLMQSILQAGRNFLIRIDDNMLVLLEDFLLLKKDTKKRKGRKKKFPGKVSVSIKKKILKPKEVLTIRTKEGVIQVIPNAIIKAWADQVPSAGSVIVFHRRKFKNPLVLYSSETNLSVDRILELVQCYHRRWKIEQIFKEEKQLFKMEEFKVTTIKALYRHIHLVMVAHTILFIKKILVNNMAGRLKEFIQWYLKTRRKIVNFTIYSLKIFLEKCYFNRFDFKSDFRLFDNL